MEKKRRRNQKGSKRTASRRSFLPLGKKERRSVEFLGGASLVLFALVIAGSFSLSGFEQYALRSSNVAAVVASSLVDLANQDRTQNGVAGLQTSPLLTEAAQEKANDMAQNGYFAHTSPQGLTPWYWFQQVGYDFEYAGENLAVNFSDSDDVNTAWMNSPEHRANLLDPHYTQIGIATAQGLYQGEMTTFVVEEFGTPAPTSTPQQQIASQNVPAEPTQIATAAATGSQVLAAQESVAPAPAPTPEQQAPQPQPQTAQPQPVPQEPAATTAPALAAQLSAQDAQHAPWWSPFVANPRQELLDFYYVLAALILAGLALDTGFELHRRHRQKAMRAGALLVALALCFVVANVAFFGPPTLLQAAQSQDAAAAIASPE